MLSLDEAQSQLLALATRLPSQSKPLSACSGHYLAEPVIAKRTQPAADLSAMDGYALSSFTQPGPWRVIGESAAGRPFGNEVGAGEAVRIFTGAHVPAGCDTVLIQEDAIRDGATLKLNGSELLKPAAHIRRAGGDFLEGSTLLETGIKLTPGAIAVAAMAGYGTLNVGGRPHVSILASGDELRAPGELCDDAHIPSSNTPMLVAMLSGLPCDVTDCGIVEDTMEALETAIQNCMQSDIIVTTGGASVGDHDLVEPVLRKLGAQIDFWKVAIRPGKPLIVGRIGKTIILGLPGNPSSAYVTATLFLLPLVRFLAGCTAPLPKVNNGTLNQAIAAGGKRTELFRAIEENGVISIFSRQDSGMLTPLSMANALLINPVDEPARVAGEPAQFLRID